MVVENGYKQTEVGIIPREWSIAKIGSFTDVTAGGTPSTMISQYWNGDIRWMNSGDLNLKKVFDVENRITEFGLSNSATRLIPPKCVLIGLAGQGKTRGTVAMNMVELCTNQSIAAIHPSKLINQDYLFYNLDKRYFELRGLSTGDGGRGGLNLTIIKNLLIACPPLHEQTAIATALSDMDALIAQTEKLIEKKKAIKQGVMQELLKPKDGWVTRKLGEVCEIYTGRRNNQDKKGDGEYPFFVRSQIVEKIDTYSFDGEAILVPGEGNIGKIFHYINGKFDFHQRVYKISGFSKDVHPKYVFLFLKENFGRYALANTVKATVDSLRLPTFLEFELPFPSSIEEQSGIAELLFDMDGQLNCLISKLQKLKLQKQGMMQALLTGKIRLV
jgi:type I restriction enzyme S subunit